MNNSSNQRLPEEIYVRRRVAAAIILLVVIALFVWIVTRFTGGDNQETASVADTSISVSREVETTSETSETSESSEAVEPSEPSESAEPESAEPTHTPNTDGPGITRPEQTECSLADLQITAASDRGDYGPDVQPHFYFIAHNPTAANCVINLDEAPMRFEVYALANNHRMWADIDCNEPEARGELKFAPGEERRFEAVWSRTTSSPESCADRQPVAPGSYYLHTVIGDNASEPYLFTLR